MAQHVHQIECEATEEALNAALDEHEINIEQIIAVLLHFQPAPIEEPDPKIGGPRYRVLWKN